MNLLYCHNQKNTFVKTVNEFKISYELAHTTQLKVWSLHCMFTSLIFKIQVFFRTNEQIAN